VVCLKAERRLVGRACNATLMQELSARDASLSGLDMGSSLPRLIRACKQQQYTNPSCAQYPCSYAIRHPATDAVDALVLRVPGPCATFAVNRTVGHSFNACALTGVALCSIDLATLLCLT
jgi:hypothetical protein